MKKFFTLMTLLVAMVTNAWGTTEWLYYNATGITVSGTTATMTSGLKLVQGDSKNLANGKNVTCDGTAYQAFKLSTGSRNLTITAPSGSEITSITIYSYENNATPDGGAWTVTTGTEISSTAGTVFTKGSNDTADPDKQVFVFEPVSSVSLSWTGKQNCPVFKVEYFSTSTDKYTLTAVANPVSGAKSISSARSYYEGSTAYLSTEAADGYAFTNWTDAADNAMATTLSWFATMPAANTTYTANFYSATTHTIIGAIADGQNTYGSITNEGSNVVVEDEDITFTATANEGYAFVNWTKGGSVYSTDASITVKSTSANEGTYTANFTALCRVSFNLDTYHGDINTSKLLQLFTATINEKWADASGNFTIPSYAHKYLYREGYIFAGWSDGVKTYASGETITGLTANVTLEPTWTATTASLSDSQNKNVVTWSLAKADIVFADWQSSAYGYYTQSATVNGEAIAVPMKIVNGKVGNYGRSDALAQTNQETKFTIPAVKGMVVSIADAYTNISTTTIAGSTDYEGTGTKSISYTYTGTDETIDIVIKENNQYLTSIVVTYPVTATAIDITPAKPYTTYVSEANLDFTDHAKLTAYIATAANSTSVTLTKVEKVPAGTPIVLEATETGSAISVPVATSTDAVSGNLLKAGDGTTTIGGDSKFDYILVDSKFYRAEEGKVAVGKAYLHLESAPTGARTLDLNIGGGGATGIETIKVGTDDNVYYDLQGRRVLYPTKGLYIVNGKKVILK